LGKSFFRVDSTVDVGGLKPEKATGGVRLKIIEKKKMLASEKVKKGDSASISEKSRNHSINGRSLRDKGGT